MKTTWSFSETVPARAGLLGAALGVIVACTTPPAGDGASGSASAGTSGGGDVAAGVGGARADAAASAGGGGNGGGPTMAPPDAAPAAPMDAAARDASLVMRSDASPPMQLPGGEVVLTPTDDTWIYDKPGNRGASDAPHPAAPRLQQKHDGVTGTKRAYFRFDIATLKTASSATLTLFIPGDESSMNARTLGVFPIADSDWSETTASAQSHPAVPPHDALGTPLGTYVVPAANPAVMKNILPHSFTVDLTAHVKAQLTAGTKAFSLFVLNVEDRAGRIDVNSKEAPPGSRPTLTVKP